MPTDLKKFLQQYIALNDDEIDTITKRFKPKTVKKNDFLLREGDTCEDLIFVQQGCLRLYYISNDIEVSVWFAFNNNSAIEIYSFISGRPTNYFLQAIEDTEVLYLPKTELEKLYSIYPPVQEMMRKYWEDVILNIIDRFTSLQKDSAEQRYLNLLQKPTYLQKIPQKYLASFIGVTPTSLSRIRKGIK